jgi:hypothetical protein
MRVGPIVPPGVVPAASWFAVLAVLLTWPTAGRLATHVPGAGAGDNMMFLWNFWWMREALWGSGELFRSSALFVPVGVDLVQHTHTALPAFVGATALAGLPAAAALNLTILGSYALNGFCTYLLAWHLTRDRMAALLAGTFFAAAPFFASHLLGHFNLMAGWLLPLFLLAMIRALDDGQVWRAAVAGLVLVAAAYADYYYLAYLFVLLTMAVAWRCVRLDAGRGEPRPLADAGSVGLLLLASLAAGAAGWIAATGGGTFVLFGVDVSATSGRNLRTAAWLAVAAWWWRRHRPSLRLRLVRTGDARRAVRSGAVALVVFAVGAAPLLAGAVALWQAGDYATPPYLWLSAPAGIDIASLVGGNPFHPVWGGAVRGLYAAADIDLVEGTAWLGLVPLVVLAARARSGPSAGAPAGAARFWIAVAAVFLVWALGPRLVVLGADTGVILPATLIRFVPVLSNVRIPARAIVVVYLAAGVMLALWWAGRPRSLGAAALVMFAILADFLPAPVASYELRRPAVYAELAGRPAGAVLELPIGLRDGFGEVGMQKPETLHYQTLHGRAMAGGAVARLPDSTRRAYLESEVLGPLVRLSGGEPPGADARRPSAADFVALGIRYVVYDAAASPDALRRHVETRMPVRLLAARDGLALYAIE